MRKFTLCDNLLYSIHSPAVSFQHTLAKEKSERSLDRLELAEKKLEQFAQQQRMLVASPCMHWRARMQLLYAESHYCTVILSYTTLTRSVAFLCWKVDAATSH